MNPAEGPSSGKPNPFYKPAFGTVVRRQFLGLMAATFGWTMLSPASAQDATGKGKGKGGKGGKGGGDDQSKARGPVFQGEYVLPESLAEYSKLSLIFGRATERAITASFVPASTLEAFLEIGTAKGKYTRKTSVTQLPSGKATEVVIDGLSPNTEYFYRLNYRKPGAGNYTQRAEARFATQKAPGSSFVFTIQGDSHPERPQSSHPDLYARTLATAAADKPDFHICIGDDFSIERIRTITDTNCAVPYLLQRPFLGLVGSVGQVFLMNGNHEQASLFNFSQKDERHDVAVGVQKARNQLYPLPGNEGIYTGAVEPFKDIGALKSYCAWTWGDALFVLLDNYWHSPVLVDSGFGGKGGKGEKGDDKKNRDWWGITIGDAQYHWLKKTLETSKAKHKFVFAHHVLGSGRGGVDEADLYEWGGFVQGEAPGLGTSDSPADGKAQGQRLLPGPRPPLLPAGEGRHHLSGTPHAFRPRLRRLQRRPLPVRQETPQRWLHPRHRHGCFRQGRIRPLLPPQGRDQRGAAGHDRPCVRSESEERLIFEP